MNKKSIFLIICIVASIFTKAQITSIEYPSGYLSEEKIYQILEKSRKNGIQEWEVQKQNEILHSQLKKQIEAIANGTYNNSFSQKTIQAPLQVMQACTNPGFETGDVTGWVLTQGSNSNNGAGATLPCPSCFTATGGVYEVTSLNGTSTAYNNPGNNVGGDASATCKCSSVDCGTNFSAGIDAFGNFPVVAPGPFGGAHSLLLNNSNCGNLMQRASQTFNVTASNNSFTYQYAGVLQDGGHSLSDSPYLDVHLTDALGSVIPCSQYSVAAANITGGSVVGW